jgi:hypothetical protein
MVELLQSPPDSEILGQDASGVVLGVLHAAVILSHIEETVVVPLFITGNGIAATVLGSHVALVGVRARSPVLILSRVGLGVFVGVPQTAMGINITIQNINRVFGTDLQVIDVPVLREVPATPEVFH